MEIKTLSKLLVSMGYHDVNPAVMLYKYQTGIMYYKDISAPWFNLENPLTKAELKRKLRQQGKDTRLLSSIERKILSQKKSLQPVLILRDNNNYYFILEGLLTAQVANYLSKGSSVIVPCRIEEPYNYTEEDLLHTIGTLLLKHWNDNSKNPLYGYDPTSFSINVSDQSLIFHSIKELNMFSRHVMRAMDIYHNFLRDPGYISSCLNEYDIAAQILVKYLAEGNPPIQSLNTTKIKLAAHLCSIFDRYFPYQAPHTIDIVNGRIVQNERYSGGSYIDTDLELYMGWMNNPADAFSYMDSKSESIRTLAKDFLINGPPDPGVLA